MAGAASAGWPLLGLGMAQAGGAGPQALAVIIGNGCPGGLAADSKPVRDRRLADRHGPSGHAGAQQIVHVHDANGLALVHDEHLGALERVDLLKRGGGQHVA